MAYSKSLTINGWTPPNPKEDGIIIGKEPIWSENTGRAASGLMIGDIIAVKTTLELSWSKLTQSQLTALEEAIGNKAQPFFLVTYCNEAGQSVSKYFYVAPRSFTRKKYTKDDIIYSEVSIRFIEQ